MLRSGSKGFVDGSSRSNVKGEFEDIGVGIGEIREVSGVTSCCN